MEYGNNLILKIKPKKSYLIFQIGDIGNIFMVKWPFSCILSYK